MRARIREVIVTLVEGELTETLAALPSPRTEGRRGDRHGSEPRTITTGLGAAPVERPRGRLRKTAGGAKGSVPGCRGMSAGRGPWTRRGWGPLGRARTSDGSQARWLRCGAGRRCRSAPAPGWWVG
ncbi:hypothetical protein [Nitrospira sp. Kam-Ns4a]